MSRDDLAAHLEFFAELGVTGVSTDPVWRRRPVPDAPAPVAPADAPVTAVAPAVTSQAVAVEAVSDEAVSDSAVPANGGTVGAGTDEPAPASIALVRVGSLPLIRTDIGDCTRCKLHTLGRTQIVFGVGNPEADLMFVGEAPGADEDEQGVPFIGRAGQLLTKIIEAIELTRDQVYIANVIKCRPPANRNPEPDEVAQCEPFLFRQIDAIRPKVIVALGKFAAQSLLRTTEPITKLRGREFPFRDAVLMPTFHPAYLLRNPSAKREVWEDMKRVRELLNARAGR